MKAEGFFQGNMNIFLWSTLIGLILFYLVRKWILFKRMPPGPYGLPVIGSIIHFTKFNALDEFRKLKHQYGDIFSFSAGDYYVIVINGYKHIQELYKREDFSGRPDFHVWKLRNLGKRNRGILVADEGPTWQEQRRFSLRTLRDFGFGKQNMEGMITYEMQELVNLLKQDLGKPKSLTGIFNASVLNSLWCILTGKRYELDDPKFTEAIDLLISNLQSLILVYPGLFFPWPAKFGVMKRKAWEETINMRMKIRALIMEHMNEHKATYDPSETRDFIDAYMHEMNRSKADSSFHGDEGEKNLFSVLLDMFLAGVETTSTTLLWSVLFMILFPETQKKIQEEIDAVIGERVPTRDDRRKMIYLEAFLSEVLRKSTILPMSFYRKMQGDCEYNGFLFPKDAVIFLNLHDSNHDAKAWENPDEFCPERFLDKTRTKIVKHEASMPFGVGQRQCIGEPLAKDTLFIFLVGLCQNLNFALDPETKDLDMKGTPTFIMSPKPFNVIISSRK